VTDLVRTIDLAPWFGGNQDALESLLRLVDGECRRVGFLRLTGHGVAAELMDRMLATTSEFFDLPEAEKLSHVLADKARNRGYAAYGSEALAYSLGVDAKPDMFEAFNCGVEVVDELDPYVANERHRMFAENVWPHRPVEMREVWTEYFDACRALALELMRMFSLALDMPESYLAEHTSRGPSVMRANNYERRSEHPAPVDGQLRMGAHSDYGVCTLLLADPVPGLQIVGPDGAWHDVLPEPGTFLVNLGDLLAEWTNDRWRSTVHRVVPPKRIDGPARRRSIAFFFEADYDAVVSVMSTCVGPDGVSKYAPITAGEHLMNKLMGPRTMQPSTADQSTLGDRRAAVTEA
jgi:isopenicillin N synthase-like dioxygenase